MKKSPALLWSLVIFALLSLSPACKTGNGDTGEGEISIYSLAVQVGEGVSGTPGSGTYSHNGGDTVTYDYQLESGYTDLSVTLDGQPVSSSGSFTMNSDRTLSASAELAADYFVSTQGNDNNNGKSIDQSFRTIAKAFQAVQGGRNGFHPGRDLQ
ncbi:MAG: hypothetical protein GY940_16395 [bacterium]|nr:hypothetical protein [bacterium]